MILVSIIFITAAFSLTSLPSIRWDRIGVITLFISTFLALEASPLLTEVSLVSIEESINLDQNLNLFNHLLQTNYITGSIDIFMLFIAGLLFIPFYSSKTDNSITGSESGSLVEYVPSSAVSLQMSPEKKQETLLFGLCTLLGSIILVGSSDLISLLLGIELQSYSLYIIATSTGLFKNKGFEPAESAGLKYYLLGALASALILLGIGIIYAVTGTTNLNTLSAFLSSTLGSNGDGVIVTMQNETEWSHFTTTNSAVLGILLILTGFIWKFAGAPLHNWSIDVYDAVPTIGASWLAVIPKIALLTITSQIILSLQNLDIEELAMNTVFFDTPISDISTFSIISSNLLKGNEISYLILLVSILSMVIGAVGALSQPLIKRLLAYSSIGQVGFILLGISMGAQDATIFYLIQYTITNAGLWLCLIICPLVNKVAATTSSYPLWKDRIDTTSNKMNTEIEIPTVTYTLSQETRNLKELQGLYTNNIYISISFAILLFSTAGVPPLVGFFAKYEILSVSINEGYLWVSVIAIVASLISAAYYLRVIRYIWFSGPSEIHNLTENYSKIDKNKLVHSKIYSTLPVVHPVLTTERIGTDSIHPNNLTESVALAISVITLIVSMFILQGSVFIIWCKLICNL